MSLLILEPAHPLPAIGTTRAGQTILLGGFSGLVFESQKRNLITALTLTDRGPNPEPEDDRRPFILPEFTPEIIRLELNLDAKNYRVLDRIPMLSSDGKPKTGLPWPTGKQETPIDLYSKRLIPDPNGIDSESLALDPDGKSVWVGEEYGPSLMKFDLKTGREVQRLSPGAGLPLKFADRKVNRGFEAIAITKGKLYAFLQSPIPGHKLQNTIAEVDLSTFVVHEFSYEHRSKITIRLGDAIGLPDGDVLVIERDEVVGTKSEKFIYRVEFGNPGLKVKKELVLNLAASGFPHPKAEGLMVLPDGSLAVLNDNDFGVDGHADFEKGTFPMKNEVPKIYIFSAKTPFF